MVRYENKDYSSLSEIADEIDPATTGYEQKLAFAAEARLQELLNLYLKTKHRDAQVRSWEYDLKIVLAGIDRMLTPGLTLLPNQSLVCARYQKPKRRLAR